MKSGLIVRVLVGIGLSLVTCPLLKSTNDQGPMTSD